MATICAPQHRTHLVRGPYRAAGQIWLMDVGKQGASGVCCHAAGLLNGSILEKATRDAGAHGNQCSWYFISFSFDT
jgi:hypothetical protein